MSGLGDFILARVRNFRSRKYATLSYSQEGEDLAIKRILGNIHEKPGFYIDVGCHHPFRFSNSYLFYRAGWHGVCIDPLPGCAEMFRRWRPRDIFVEAAVSATPGIFTYHMFNEAAVNTLDGANAARQADRARYTPIGTRQVQANTLGEITKDLIADGATIDFMSIDVEGLDLEVLRSNDWKRIRPRLVVVECLGGSVAEASRNPTSQFLSTMEYRIIGVTGNSYLFQDVRTMGPTRTGDG